MVFQWLFSFTCGIEPSLVTDGIDARIGNVALCSRQKALNLLRSGHARLAR